MPTTPDLPARPYLIVDLKRSPQGLRYTQAAPVHLESHEILIPYADGPIHLLGGEVAFDALCSCTDSREDAKHPQLVLIRLIAPPNEAMLGALLERGTQVLGYPGARVVLAMIPAEQRAALAKLRIVDGIAPVKAEYRLVPSLREASTPHAKTPPRPTVRLRIVPLANDAGVDLAGLLREICQASGRLVRVTPTEIECVLSRAAAAKIARRANVIAVDERERPTVQTYQAAQVIGVPLAVSSAEAPPSTDDGGGQRVAVADLGVHEGANKALPDLEGRVQISSFAPPPWVVQAARALIQSDDGADSNAVLPPGEYIYRFDASVGHGTHMAAIIAGDGASARALRPESDAIPMGMAPGATIYFQDVGVWVDWSFNYAGKYDLGPYALPTDLGDLCRDAVQKDAWVQNMSFSSSVLNGQTYTLDCELVDKAIYEHPQLCVCVAAGNTTDENDRVTAPGVAKNVLTVGACGPDRTRSTNPGSADTTDARSCQGPVDGGRIKPDVVAPGTLLARRSSGLDAPDTISSTMERDIKRSAKAEKSYADLWGTYSWAQGTSAATALVTGGVTRLRAALQARHAAALTDGKPSAALLKALVVAHAIPYGADPKPNGERGFGRVDFSNLLAQPPAQPWFFFDRPADALATGGVWSCVIQANDPTRPLIVTLVWTDPPGAAPATGLTNRLLLTAADAADTTKLHLANGRGADQAVVDNVQRVWIADPQATRWNIIVAAPSVTVGPFDANNHPTQAWALVVVNGTLWTAEGSEP